MGMYDTITFRCPKCSGEISTQSKAGECDLDMLRGERGVPAAVAADIEGEVINCPDCCIDFEILSIVPLDRVPLRLFER